MTTVERCSTHGGGDIARRTMLLMPQNQPDIPSPGDAAESSFVSRAGVKLAHALNMFGLNPRGLRCADLGCNVGGFTDCLLQRGAASVHAVDTGYGVLDWRLRNDPRVTVMERTNALHLVEKLPGVTFDLIVIDLGWTAQRLAIPAALRVLRPGGAIVSLVKPHYEVSAEEKASLPRGGALSDAAARQVLDRVIAAMPGLGFKVAGVTESPIRGGKSSRRGAGNVEYLMWGRPIAPQEPGHAVAVHMAL